MSLAKVPPTLKAIAHYIKIANENASRDPVIYYWCLFHAVQAGMQIDKTSPEALTFLTSLLGTLETIKKQLAGNDAITSEVVGQAHVENFAMKLFDYADKKEKAGQIDKSVVHAFYTAGHVMDVLTLFGEIDEPYASAKKYAKWKSTQIFACLRDGTPYVPSSQEPSDSMPGGSGMAHEHQYQDSNNPFDSNPTPYQPPRQNNDFGLPQVPTHTNRPIPPNIPPQPQMPQPSSTGSFGSTNVPSSGSGGGGGANPTFQEWEQIRKYTKYVISAIDYEDVKAAIDNLRKALEAIPLFMGEEKEKKRRNPLSLVTRKGTKKVLGKWRKLENNADAQNGELESSFTGEKLFGRPLELALRLDPSLDEIQIPAIVRQSIDYVNAYGLDLEGIYRVSSPKSRLDELEKEANSRANPLHFCKISSTKALFRDAHEAAGLLKRFLRALPESTIPPKVDELAEQCVCDWKGPCTCEVSNLVFTELTALQKPQRHLLAYVFIHAQQVIQQEPKNKMGVPALGLLLQQVLDTRRRTVCILLANASPLLYGFHDGVVYFFADVVIIP
ncbi:unnamed protein product, partial [Mesorhabditis belari]|uniref:Rho-GAP domain-containing protein n=1 Tax=Mesorhabditis belari TaxID=2138241 RepID=A0AAF3F8A4_9BILA